MENENLPNSSSDQVIDCWEQEASQEQVDDFMKRLCGGEIWGYDTASAIRRFEELRRKQP